MVETLYPGVYVTEVAFEARPIDGVSTSTGPFTATSAATSELLQLHTSAPDWTQTSQGDPGVTLLQLIAHLGESLQFRSGTGPFDPHMHASLGRGIAAGLAIDTTPASSGSGVSLTAGLVLTPKGQPLESDRHTAHRVRKP